MPRGVCATDLHQRLGLIIGVSSQCLKWMGRGVWATGDLHQRLGLIFGVSVQSVFEVDGAGSVYRGRSTSTATFIC